ncbi:MAG: hypothetical protein GX853_05735 [Chloroflexi bacterium]|nr:hypothetical protein [Chloroflexota bacterium]
MPNAIEIPYMFKLLGSIFLAFLLFGIAMIFIKKTRDKRQQNTIVRPHESLIPFPQTAPLPEDALSAGINSYEERTQTIRDQYRAWLERYILPTYDNRGAFVRVGVERKRLRYQVTTTSLAQSFAMLQSVLIAGDDLSAPDLFERLLAFTIAYPSNHSEDLSSWMTMPDMTSSAKLEADPHAEAWIAYSLLMAEKQWEAGRNFNYDRVLDYRLKALLALQQDIEPVDHKRAIYAPVFFEAFAKRSNSEAWLALAESLREELLKNIQDAELVSDGSAEEAWLAFSAFHVGMAGLLLADESHKKLAKRFESLVYSTIKNLPAKLENAEDDGLSPLALIAACAPLAMLQNDQDLVDKYWQVLSTFNAKSRDAIGESLRLLALMVMNGHFWRLTA